MNLFKVVLVLALAAGAVFFINEYKPSFEVADTSRYDHPAQTGRIDFWTQVNPVLETRCVVCHACYDASCQLKLSSYEGITRGITDQRVYNAERLMAAHPTRLFEDANSVSEWRELGFSPVLNEREFNAEKNISGSVLAQMLILKDQNPLPIVDILPESFDFALNRDQQCSAIDEFDDFRKDYPLWGMPYGLPGLNTEEKTMLLDWIAEGAPYSPLDPVTPVLQEQVELWETFFNRDSLKGRLVSRYLYEHLFLAHLYFGKTDQPVFFELVRSATPPGQAVKRISTRVPFADPEVERVYYRLQPLRESISVKNHMPYILDDSRLELWHDLFFETDYEVNTLLSYELAQAANPFLSFADLPAESRYKFLLSEAQFTIMGFIKGPVCRGETALEVINDHFWVFFTDPEKPFASEETPAMAQVLRNMGLPAGNGSTENPLEWRDYADQEKKYMDIKHSVLSDASVNAPFDLDLVWNGANSNSNTALTIFRHFDSATVEKGLLGGEPQSAWLINYPLLERIHYLLVSGYDVFGNLGHQLNTRVYMDFLRMEGENNFLTLLTDEARISVHKQWYRGTITGLEDHLNQFRGTITRPTSIRYRTDEPLHELYELIAEHVEPATKENVEEKSIEDEHVLQKLDNAKGEVLALLPEVMFLAVNEPDSDEQKFFTLLHHATYSNISILFDDQERRLPEEDTLSVLKGFVGAYPNVFFKVNRGDLESFVQRIETLQEESDYKRLLDDYGVRRSSPDFWKLSDTIHETFLSTHPVDGGLFDYNRLENR